MDILFAPGFNSDGLNAGHKRSATLMALLQGYTRASNSQYISMDLRNFQTFKAMANKVEEAIANNPSLQDGSSSAVASSFGAWFLLLAITREDAPQPRFKRIVLVAPFVEVHSIYYGLWPVIREIPKLTGFWRKGTTGAKGFYVWPSQVREMLAPANNLYAEGRLSRIAKDQPITIILAKGSYAKPKAVKRLAKALGMAEEDIRTDLDLPLSAEDFEKVLIGL